MKRKQETFLSRYLRFVPTVVFPPLLDALSDRLFFRRHFLRGLLCGLLLGALHGGWSTPAAADEPHPLSGRWRGTFEPVPGEPVAILLQLVKPSPAPEDTADRPLEGKLWSPELGIDGVALSELSFDEDGIHFTVAALDGAPTFVGKLSGPNAFSGAASRSPDAPPGTDIFLIDFDRSQLPWTVRTVKRLTDRLAYDNQPHFSADGQNLIYTAFDRGQTDLVRLHLASGRSAKVAETPESEYSPTPMPVPIPGTDAVSTVRVEADGTQRLWKFSSDNSVPEVLLPDVAPVGYHLWLDDNRLALFVLGEPNQLEIVELGTQTRTNVASDIGRALHHVPGEAAFAYVHKPVEGAWSIRTAELNGKGHRTVMELPEGREDFVYLDEHHILVGDDTELLIADLRKEPVDWQPAVDLAAHGLRDITRLALDPNGPRMSIVSGRNLEEWLREIPFHLERFAEE